MPPNLLARSSRSSREPSPVRAGGGGGSGSRSAGRCSRPPASRERHPQTPGLFGEGSEKHTSDGLRTQSPRTWPWASKCQAAGLRESARGRKESHLPFALRPGLPTPRGERWPPHPPGQQAWLVPAHLPSGSLCCPTAPSAPQTQHERSGAAASLLPLPRKAPVSRKTCSELVCISPVPFPDPAWDPWRPRRLLLPPTPTNCRGKGRP